MKLVQKSQRSNLSVRVMFHLASSRRSWFLLWIETKYHLSLATENKEGVCHCVCECLQVNIWISACLKSPKGSSQGYDEWILQGGSKSFSSAGFLQQSWSVASVFIIFTCVCSHIKVTNLSCGQKYFIWMKDKQNHCLKYKNASGGKHWGNIS